MARSDERAKPPPSGGGGTDVDAALAALDARVTALEAGQAALDGRLDTAELAIDALEDRVTALEGAAVEPPPIIEPPPIEPPPVITGTLSAALAFPDRTVTFAMSDGVDMGNYVAPTAGFTQGCVRVHNDTLPNFFVDFRLDADGAHTEVVFWNGECAGDVASGYTRDLAGYTATIADEAGTTIHTETVPHHYWGSRWRWQSEPRPVIRSAAQVFSEGFLPTMTPHAARIEGYSGLIVPQPPGPQGAYTTFMPATGDWKIGIQCAVDGGGERPEIGLVTEWQADWLLRGTATSLATLIQQAEMCAGDWGWFIPDQVTGAPVNYKVDDAHYRMHEYQNQDYGGHFIKFGNRNGWDIHEAEAHIPSLFYLPYALTEDPYFVEAQQYLVQYATGWTIYQRETVFQPLGDKIVCSYTNEIRTLGWGIRNLACVHKMTPAGGPKWLLPQSYYDALSADYLTVVDELFTKSPKNLHRIFRQLGSDPYWQAFEQAYAIMGMGLADLVGLPGDWKAQLDFYFGMFVGLTDGTSGWDRQVPQPHDIDSSYVDGCADWAEAMAHPNIGQLMKRNATFPDAASPGNRQGGSMGNCSQMAAACAVAKQRGVTAATAALDWMNTFVDFNYPNNSDAAMGINFYAKCGFSG